MRAVQAACFGGPEVLKVSSLADPVAGAGQVVVDVSAAPVLMIDAQIRAGRAQEWFSTRPPYVPGAGVAGTVSEVGDGIDTEWMGVRVVADTPEGGYVERVALADKALVEVPEGLALDVAAALLHDGRTALGLKEVTGPREGEWVLVVGAGGGMGAVLVQVCASAGARVIGAARGDEKLRLAKRLGAEAVVDYTQPAWVTEVHSLTGDTGADVVLDGVGGDIGMAAFAALAQGGRFSAHGAAAGGFAAIDSREAKDRGVTVTGIDRAQFDPETAKRLTANVLAEAAAGRVEPVIGQRFPLDQAAEAHRAIEARTVVGKTLLEVRS
jgi:NADPH2:quinone reductase